MRGDGLPKRRRSSQEPGNQRRRLTEESPVSTHCNLSVLMKSAPRHGLRPVQLGIPPKAVRWRDAIHSSLVSKSLSPSRIDSEVKVLIARISSLKYLVLLACTAEFEPMPPPSEGGRFARARSDKVTFLGRRRKSLSIVRAQSDWPADCRYSSSQNRTIRNRRLSSRRSVEYGFPIHARTPSKQFETSPQPWRRRAAQATRTLEVKRSPASSWRSPLGAPRFRRLTKGRCRSAPRR